MFEDGDRLGNAAGEPAGVESAGAVDATSVFYIHHAGTQYGPVELATVLAWYIEGSLDRSTLLWDPDAAAWVAVADFAPFRELAARSARRDHHAPRDGKPRPPLPAPVVAGTAVYPAGFRGEERRRALRLPIQLRLEFHLLDPRSRQPASLLYSYALDNISIGGFGFSIVGTDIQAGTLIRSWIELEPESVIVSLGEVVRVRGRRAIGVGFRDVSDRLTLEEFLSRRRP